MKNNCIISRGDLLLEVELPQSEQGYYTGSRFDWSGMISKAVFCGHTFVEQPFEDHVSTESKYGVGTAEEFRAFRPKVADGLGYPEADVGEGFIKIGVGILEKEANEDYNFSKDYRVIRPGEWDISTRDDSVTFHQRLILNKQHGYEYEKQVIIDDDGVGFRIHHRLVNSGLERIHINHYCHNFFMIDACLIGPRYELESSYNSCIEENKLINDQYFQRHGHSLKLIKEIPGKGVFVGGHILGNNEDVNEVYKVMINGGNTGVAISGSVSTIGAFLAIGRRYFSIEPQIEMVIPFGESFEWTNNYRLWHHKS